MEKNEEIQNTFCTLINLKKYIGTLNKQAKLNTMLICLKKMHLLSTLYKDIILFINNFTLFPTMLLYSLLLEKKPYAVKLGKKPFWIKQADCDGIMSLLMSANMVYIFTKRIK